MQQSISSQKLVPRPQIYSSRLKRARTARLNSVLRTRCDSTERFPALCLFLSRLCETSFGRFSLRWRCSRSSGGLALDTGLPATRARQMCGPPHHLCPTSSPKRPPRARRHHQPPGRTKKSTLNISGTLSFNSWNTRKCG